MSSMLCVTYVRASSSATLGVGRAGRGQAWQLLSGTCGCWLPAGDHLLTADCWLPPPRFAMRSLPPETPLPDDEEGEVPAGFPPLPRRPPFPPPSVTLVPAFSPPLSQESGSSLLTAWSFLRGFGGMLGLRDSTVGSRGVPTNTTGCIPCTVLMCLASAVQLHPCVLAARDAAASLLLPLSNFEIMRRCLQGLAACITMKTDSLYADLAMLILPCAPAPGSAAR
jgi:hypothetical protein